MIDTKDIIKMAKHVFKRTQGYPDKRIIHPIREWGIGLFFFLVIVIIGGIQATNLFMTYQNLDQIQGHSNTHLPRYDAQLVTKTLTIYQSRAATYNALAGAPSPTAAIHAAAATTTASTTAAAKKTPTTATTTLVHATTTTP